MLATTELSVHHSGPDSLAVCHNPRIPLILHAHRCTSGHTEQFFLITFFKKYFFQYLQC